MAGMRTYGDPCGLSRALDIVGERWALLIVRELLFGPKRFTDLRAGLPGASPNVLAQRLDELEGAGVLCHHKLPAPAASAVYELTERGRQLETALIELSRWGSATPRIRGAELSPDALLLALKTMFDAKAAHDARLVIGLRVDGRFFRVAIDHGTLEITHDPAHAADATVETDGATMRRVMFGGQSLSEAQRRGRLTLTGQKSAVTRFLKLFATPGSPASGT